MQQSHFWADNDLGTFRTTACDLELRDTSCPERIRAAQAATWWSTLWWRRTPATTSAGPSRTGERGRWRPSWRWSGIWLISTASHLSTGNWFYNSHVEGADRAQARCLPAWLLRVRGSEEDLHCDSLPLRPTTRLSERRWRIGQVLRVRPVQGEDHLPRTGQPVYRATGVLLRPCDRPKLWVHLLLLWGPPRVQPGDKVILSCVSDIPAFFIISILNIVMIILSSPVNKTTPTSPWWLTKASTMSTCSPGWRPSMQSSNARAEERAGAI